MTINKRDFLIAQVTCFLPGMLGSLATASSVNTWYPTLQKPSFTPPGYLFGPVWTVLYFLQGLSLYWLTTTPSKDDVAKLMAKIFFALQLFLNLLWSLFFFGLKNVRLGFAEIGFLVITVIFTIITTFRVHKPAALILLPYLAWISFASYLNYTLMTLNR